jgi:hypothetical protein
VRQADVRPWISNIGASGMFDRDAFSIIWGPTLAASPLSPPIV